MNKRCLAFIIIISIIGIYILVLRFDGNLSIGFRAKKNSLFRNSDKIEKIEIDTLYNWDFYIDEEQSIVLEDNSIIQVIEEILKSQKSNEGMIYTEMLYSFNVHFFVDGEELIGCRIMWNEDKQTIEIGFFDGKRATRDFYKINKKLRDRLFEYVRSNLNQD